MRRLGWFLLGALVGPAVGLGLLYLLAAKSSRPGVAAGPEVTALPWGAIDHEHEVPAAIRNAIIEASRRGASANPSSPEDKPPEIPTFRFLALSGGGSNGAFGAGLLCGWTAAGTRPDFDVVTGVSTGSLQATFAFLGSDYDDQLESIYTDHDTEALWTKRSPLAAAFSDGLYDTAPLADLIESYLTDEVLAAVAAKHLAGGRLYVGTTNMDTSEFVIWDLGMIAASGRPDAREHYRDVLLASSSVPVLHPPQYFQIEQGGETYHEMHVDGGITANVFFRGFLVNLNETLRAIEIAGKIHAELYVIKNGSLPKHAPRQTIGPRPAAIASRTIERMFDITTHDQLYRMYVLTGRAGMGFNLAVTPDDFPPLDSATFDRPVMAEIFEGAYRLGKEGYTWMDKPPRLDSSEAF